MRRTVNAGEWIIILTMIGLGSTSIFFGAVLGFRVVRLIFMWAIGAMPGTLALRVFDGMTDQLAVLFAFATAYSVLHLLLAIRTNTNER